ncbi:hypothetical protein ISF_08682 [Cordyceps fumosorosea ARSEF 2679]|uniref:Transcription factor hoxa13 n=1 Tax=Cordyceps fumosorosea (strain ARSEF 2679) TaxID=1081104 RepID=A0A167LZZ3_CORFA|nr:hypothetical protein ISF_08682 [Cordyceps fumosorosea ARSEF 2679]OAA53743.1 hypothetical protein ISF_08682 [Cordyceps fumosorosea ARSEF 2679]
MAEAPNGSAQPSAKGNGSRKVTTTTKPGFVRWSISLVARLATWAVILTILFRCPPTLQDCDESSPFVCKHYFRVKNAVTPHAKPYYDRYAAPYVDVARPYYDTVKTNVVTPIGHYAVHYGEPWAAKGRDYALTQWEVNGQPRIAQLHAVSQAQYDKTLAPHVSKAVALAAPYYDAAKTQSLYAVDSIVYPAYEFSKPYAIHGYDTWHNFALTTVLPAAQWTWSNTNAFLDRAVWPQLRVVYVENVEPQLVRIGERLGRYKSHVKNKTLHESGTLAPASSSTTGSQSSYVSKPTPQNTVPDAANGEPSDEPTQSEAQVQAESSRNPVEAPEPEEDEADRDRKVREMVANDLGSWQEKFATQAEQGAAEIEDSIDDISRRMIDEGANVVGVALTQQLQDTITTEVANLKEKINALVSQHLEGAEVDAHEETIQAVRAAGIAIKSKAQAIRSWREQYDEDVQSTVLSTSDVHFAILDETRSLALQQIGMKWAWTDGITYKDWAKYHELKSTLSDWTEELKQMIVTHPTLLEAQDAVVRVEDRGMAIAAAAARELASLKEVVQWKIDAEDVADEFDADRLKAIVEERARLAEEARLKAEEEARLKAEEEARLKAEEEARAKAEEDARVKAEEEARVKAEEEARAAQEAADEDEDEDVRIHSMKESIESKPLVSVDVDVEYTEEDERMRSVREARTSHPLISEAVPEAAAEETEEPGQATPEETPADADGNEEEEKPAVPKGNGVPAQAANGGPKHTQPVQPPNAVDR